MHDKNIKFKDSINFSAYEKPSLKANLLFFTILLFLASILSWAAFTSIDEIVKGNGKIIPSSRIQSIQSVDGGTIEKILVKEGSIVKAGEELVIIDDIRFNSLVDELKNDLYSYKTQIIRLKAQLSLNSVKKIPKLEYPELLKKNAAQYVTNEKEYYKNKISELLNLVAIEQSKHKQKQQEYKELKRKIRKLDDSVTNIKTQLKITKKGVNSGVMSKLDELKLHKELSENIGELEISRLALKRSKNAIIESKNNIQQKINIFKSESSKELSTIQTEVKKINAKLSLGNDRVKQSTIYSPVDGVVNHIYFRTIGSVIKEADVLMDIVPLNDSLLVEAKIDPKDIGFIGANDIVTVKVTAYDFSIYGGLKGKIVQIGADSIFDKETEKYYYPLIVRTENNYLESKEKSLSIIPGMIAEVNIKTGKKTILKYLLKPITKTIDNSMSER